MEVGEKCVNSDGRLYVHTTRETIIFEATNLLLNDSRLFKATINGEDVTSEEIEVHGNRVAIRHKGLLQDGFNTVSISGRDKFHKNTETQSFDIVIGSASKVIDIGATEVIKVLATVNLGGRDYEISTIRMPYGLKLTNVPRNENSSELTLRILSKDKYYIEKFRLDSIPETLSFNPIPSYINNNTEIFDNLIDWSLSDPSRVEEVTNGIRINSSTSDFVMAKTFRLHKTISSLNLSFSTNSSSLIADDLIEVDVIYFSVKSRKIQLRTMTLSQLRGVSTDERGFGVSYNKNESVEEDLTVVIRIRNMFRNLSTLQTVTVRNVETKDVDVSFTPESMSVLNQSHVNTTRGNSFPLSNVDCSSDNYNVSNSSLFKSNIEKLKFFSAGASTVMAKFSENRIYGKLTFKNVKKEDIVQIRLVVWAIGQSNQVFEVSTSLSKCAQESFDELPGLSKITFKTELDLSKPLFTFNVFQLLSLPSGIGQKVVVQVEADVYTSKGIEKIISEQSDLTILTGANASTGDTYTTEEDYDSPVAGVVRTGGDKWVLPAYANLSREIILLGSMATFKWKMGDLSKLNGGFFLGHKEHQDGRDMDISFFPIDMPGVGLVEFDYRSLNTNLKRIAFLDSFETFLKWNIDKFKYIEQIYLTRKNLRPDIDASSWINIRFANRCFENSRIIQFESPKTRGSLIIDIPGHWHHAHIKFNSVDSNSGEAIEHALNIKPVEDLDSFKYEIDSIGRLKITPLDPQFNKSNFFAWRFQDVEGYRDLEMNLEIGPTVIPAQSITYSKNRGVKKFLKVAIAKLTTGACIQREVMVNPLLAKQFKKWTYKKSVKSREWEMVKL